jgi:hypothetical protein
MLPAAWRTVAAMAAAMLFVGHRSSVIGQLGQWSVLALQHQASTVKGGALA